MMTTNAKRELSYELNQKYSLVGDKNVWVEFTGLARDYNAVNLGQVIYSNLETRIYKSDTTKSPKLFCIRVFRTIKVYHI